MYLIDTDVLSALRRRDRNVVVAHWAATIAPHDLHISVATVNEVEQGIQRQKSRDLAHAESLTIWINKVIAEFGERALPITVPIARRWARISAALGYDDLDLAIAATALEHDLVVVTRNVRDFTKTGAAIYDPFEGKTYNAKKA
jgi:predicted nucleic acid-binding protein